MSLPSFSAALGAPMTTPSPGRSEALMADAAGAAPEAALGGFAAALDEAALVVDASLLGAPDAVLPDAATPLNPALLLAQPPIAPVAVAAADATAASADAAPDRAPGAPGWPPPGLSSLFPTAPVLEPRAPTSVIAAPLASVRGIATMTLLPGVADGAPSAVPDVLATTLRSTDRGPAASLVSAATSMLATNAMAPEAFAAALARAPTPLRVPVADDGDAAALAALTDLPGAEPVPDLGPGVLAAPGTTVQKLDLAHAFPAPVPLPSPRFAEEVGARLQWIAEQQGGEATLRISPDGLGPVEIRLKLDGDRVELGFAATQQETRQALQDALPKLREMLAQQGLQLGHADVGHRQASSSNDDRRPGATGLIDDDATDVAVRTPEQRESTRVIGLGGRGLLDLYA